MHTLMLVGPAILIAVLAIGADARVWLHERGRQVPTQTTLIAAALSTAAATVHAALCPEHLREGLIYGAFFAVSAIAQLAWAGLAIFRPRRWVLAAGLAGNLAIVILWAVTRTVGIPLGPEAGEIEAVGLLDTITAVVEVALLICCAWTLTLAPRDHPLVTTS